MTSPEREQAIRQINAGYAKYGASLPPRLAVHGDICHGRVGDYSLFVDGWRCCTCGFVLWP